MRTRNLLALPALGLGLAVLAAAAPPAEAPAKPDADKIAKLVAQLGSDDFDAREKASADLEAIGDPAYDALHDALKSNDEEVRKRAETILATLDKRRESAAALKPKHVHLVYKDTPLADALADFNKQSGCNVVLSDPDGKLQDRKITLDTGDATFWQAFDQFCDKAGLQERQNDAAPVPPGVRPGVKILPAAGSAGRRCPRRPPGRTPPRPAAQQPANPPAAGIAVQPGIVIGGPVAPINTPAAADAITLIDGKAVPLPTDGKAGPLPTDASSAVRVQALPKADQFGPAPDGEIVLGLRLSVEPRMLLQSVDKVTIAKAIDDQKQQLAQTATDVGPAGAAPAPGVGFGGVGFGGAAVGRAVIMPFPGPGFGGAGGDVYQEAAVHLKKGDKASKSLSELSGTASVHLLTEATPIITADEILKAAGKTFKGGEDGQIVINSVNKTNNQVTIQLQLQPPTDSVPAGANAPGVGPVVPVRPIRPIPRVPAPPVPAPAPPAGAGAAPAAGGVAVAAAIVIGPGRWNAPGAAGLSLLDDKGNVIKLVGNQMQNQVTIINNVATVTQTYTLAFQLEKDQEPAKLVYSGRKVLNVDVPFTLKDVPLP